MSITPTKTSFQFFSGILHGSPVSTGWPGEKERASAAIVEELLTPDYVVLAIPATTPRSALFGRTLCLFRT